MSKPLSYSKWDNIELSDDETDVHPNIERESWFRMKHRSRVEREEKEETDKKRVREDMAKADFRMREIQMLLNAMECSTNKDDDDDDDDDLDDKDGLMAELEELKVANAQRQTRLDDYEKHKKWNVDNMCRVVAEKTVISTKTKTQTFNENTGYALPEDDDDDDAVQQQQQQQHVKSSSTTTEPAPVVADVGKNANASSSDAIADTSSNTKPAATTAIASPVTTASTSSSSSKPAAASTKVLVAGPKPSYEADEALTLSMMTYGQFTEKYEDILEAFMDIKSMDRTKDYLLQHGGVLLQENASSYLLLACLEDEMNGKHEKMRLVARQSQILTNIAELAKTMKKHPGNVILPFFFKMQDKEHFNNFFLGVTAFIDKVKARAIVKRKEIDDARAKEEEQEDDYYDNNDPVDLKSIPREQRLGPGGLDPLEVFETLPITMQEAFESREVERLKEALLQMDPKDVEYHMKRCIDSGLWSESGGAGGGGEEEEE